MNFQVVSDYQPKGDQPQAIEKLTQGIIDGEQFQTLLELLVLVKRLLWLMLSRKYKDQHCSGT
jgi:hypothetical protein